VPDFSKKDIIIGGIIIPGTAIPILEGMTCPIAATAALLLRPASNPVSVWIVMPFTISCWRCRYKNVVRYVVLNAILS
jgi:hypothetical protein